MGALTEVEPLTPVELAKLENHEAVIEQGMQAFVTVGRALIAIRDGKLYRIHGTFGDYCQQRWGVTQQYALNLVKASSFVERLQESETKVSFPASETHVRPLTQLPEEEQVEAWEEAVESAPDGKVTAAHVESVVRQRLREHGDPPKKPDLRAATKKLLSLLNRVLEWWPEDSHKHLGKTLVEWGKEVAETGRFPE